MTVRKNEQSRAHGVQGKKGTQSKTNLKSKERKPKKKSKTPKNASNTDLRSTASTATQQYTKIGTVDATDADDERMTTLCKDLIKYKWYHGVMPRDEINALLQSEGDFLIRKTTEKKKKIICLSVKKGLDVKHFPLCYDNGTWFIKNMARNRKFFEVFELLEFLVKENYALAPTNAVLVKAIGRPDWYILHEDIQLEKKLGSGAFGEVWKGVLRRPNESGDRIELNVAVKKMKGNQTKAMAAEFVKEAKVMRQFQHRNIVTIVGIAPSEEPMMICIELAANGCLKSYLKKNNHLPVEQLVQFTADASRGMAYLASQLLIHRDLAARNFLLGAQLEVKISDFGLSVAGNKEVKVTKMKLPTRWLAPETIDTGLFTTKTDVWSFGVATWEIFTFCESDPFPGMTNNAAKDKIRKSSSPANPPMEPPPNAPSNVAKLMLDCFAKDSEERPTFQMILKRLCPSEDVRCYDLKDPEQVTQPEAAEANSVKGKKEATSMQRKAKANQTALSLVNTQPLSHKPEKTDTTAATAAMGPPGPQSAGPSPDQAVSTPDERPEPVKPEEMKEATKPQPVPQSMKINNVVQSPLVFMANPVNIRALRKK